MLTNFVIFHFISFHTKVYLVFSFSFFFSSPCIVLFCFVLFYFLSIALSNFFQRLLSFNLCSLSVFAPQLNILHLPELDPISTYSIGLVFKLFLFFFIWILLISEAFMY